MRTMWNRLSNRLAAFRRDRRGNVAITFAMATLPMVGAVGYAVDYSHANSVKAALQAALDSTALMLARDAATISSSELDAKALTYFTALFNRPEAKNVTIKASYTTSGGSKIIVDGSATVPTTFLGVIGYDDLTVGGSSTTAWGSTRLRVALVLDTTGSMASDGKMTALKSATKDLLTQLKNAASVNGDVYVSMIPFSRGVNVGAGNYNASWIDWTEWESEPAYMSTWLANSSNKSTWDQTGPGDNCPFSSSKTGFGCTSGPSDGAGSVSKIPSSGAYSGYICPGVDSGGKDGTKAGFYYPGCYTSTTFSATGSSASCSGRSNCSCTGSGSSKVCKTNSGYYEHTWVPNARSTWTGCVADRGSTSAPGTTAGNDQTATAPTTSNKTTLYPARQDTYCPSASVGLTYNWSTLNSLVDGLDPNGGTNQPIGLVMGWHSLVGIGPYTAPPKDSNYEYSDVIILMSDGLNTWDRWYGNGSAISTAVDYRMYDSNGNGTCANIKKSGVMIYTIHVNTDGDPTSTLLKNCAGSKDKMVDTSKFFTVTSASGIAAVFNQIGTSLTQLRVAR
ncbi:MAG TPA: TadE/TadG family type IV pilus assembly protein [Pseudolabrys sp.]|nr:TadE/TadG family type IV pilus assembly protein [Pseudolabrys sp.]